MNAGHQVAKPPRPQRSPRHARPAPEVRARCPECGALATLAQILALVVAPRLAQCPRCQIGAPPNEWRAA